MSAKQDGGQAFPSEFFETEHGDRVSAFAGSPGMTLRDFIAVHAMQSIILADGIQFASSEDAHAEFAYRQADAMLKARAS